MKPWIMLSVVALVCGGCATHKLEARKAEKAAAYEALSAESKALVDRGEIRNGMTMDAVYIALGKPSQILQGENASGPIVTWVYLDYALREYRYWRMPTGPWTNPRRYGGVPYLDHAYAPQGYVSAEVVFQQGVVKSWQTLRQPK